MDAVMEILAVYAGQPLAPLPGGQGQPGVVQVAFRQDQRFAAPRGRLAPDQPGQFAQKGCGAIVVDGVGRVQPETVDMVIA